MRILCLTNMYPTTAEPWFGCFVKELVEDLGGLGVEVEVHAFDGRARRVAYAEAVAGLRRALRRDRFDLVHAHYGLTGAIGLAQRRLPLVVTFHGSETGYIPWQRYVSWVVARSSVPVFVSRSGARDLGCPNALVIPAGVDTELFRPRDRAEARRALGWAPEGRYVLLPGIRGNRRKRADLFDAAVREARRSLPELEPVSLEGLPRERVAAVMNAVDVTLMTSDWEGSPVAVRESLACMTPVVSVPVGDVPERIAGLPGCTVAPREAAALARGLLEALEAGRHPELRRRAELFSRRRVAERTVALYEAVLARNGA